jgi:CRISPR type III-A-associated RAMP protein Csm5
MIKVELETLSPLHVGNGREITPIEYVVEGDNFYRVDVDGMLRDTKRFSRERFLEFVEDAVSTHRVPYLGDFERDLAKSHQQYKLRILEKINEVRPPRIKEYIKSSERFYIPGSSIKGAILSALYWHLLKESCKDYPGIEKIVKACLTKDYSTLEGYQNTEYRRFIVTRWNSKYKRYEFQFAQILTNILFESLIVEEERKRYIEERKGKREREQITNNIKFAPWLQVTDTVPIPASNACVSLCKVFGARRDISVFYELLKPKSRLNFEMGVQKAGLGVHEILEISDRFYQRVLEVEKKWCEKNRIFVSYGDVEDGYILRLGQGSTSLATSLIILSGDLGIEGEYLKSWKVARYLTEPKTRKIVFEDGKPKYPLGWVRLEAKNE